MKRAARRKRRGLPKLSFGLVMISAFCPALLAQGQEALRSPLIGDRSIEPPPIAQPKYNPVRLGPVLGSIKLYTSVTYDDNVNAAQTDRSSEEIISAGINGSFVLPVSLQSELSLSIGVGYATYLQNSRYSSLDISPDTALTWNILIPDGYLTLFDSLSYTRQVYNEGALANTAQLPRWNNALGVRGTWLPGRWIAQAGYSYDKEFSDSSSTSYLNRSSQNIFARAGWRFAKNTQAGVEASGSLTGYGGGDQSDTTSYSIGGFADWEITPSIHANMRGGPTIYEFGATSGGSTSQLDSYYAGLDLSYQMTEHISHSVILRREVQLGLNQGSQYIEQFTAIYNTSWSITDRTVFGLNATYQEGTQPLPQSVIINVLEHFRRYGCGGNISWQCTDSFSIALTYNYWLRRSDLPNRNYTDNSVSLNLSYGF